MARWCRAIGAVAAAVLATLYGAGFYALRQEPAVRRFPSISPALAAARVPPVAIITGANIGIGFEAALELVARGYQVVVASRSKERGEAASARINSELAARELLPANGAQAEFIKLDLADLSSVTAFATAFHRRHAHLHALVLNAGMNVKIGDALAARRTVDDYEICMQSNYLGHMLLTDLLLPTLLKTAADNPVPAAPVRVVPLASVVHRFTTRGDMSDWNATFRAYGAYTYNVSKAAMVSLAEQLSRIFAALEAASAAAGGQTQHSSLGSDRASHGAGSLDIKAISVNPGAVMSEIWRHWPEVAREIARPLMALFFLSPPQGAAPAIAAATATRLADGHVLASGDYLTPYNILSHAEPIATLCEVMGPFGGVQRALPNPVAVDASVAQGLWTASLAAVANATDAYVQHLSSSGKAGGSAGAFQVGGLAFDSRMPFSRQAAGEALTAAAAQLPAA
jgi:NAD(P)-dependent dehydrogenase (short-subunit alcohol dehydrogenase family)